MPHFGRDANRGAHGDGGIGDAADTDTLVPPGRGGRKAVKWNHFLRDPQAVHEVARSRRVILGTQPADRLRKFGVGVPMLWPSQTSAELRRAPLDIQVFQALARPPASWLWAATASPERIVASVHIEFVADDTARVCEAVDVQPDGVGRDFVLSIEPAATAIARCLDTVGFGEPPTSSQERTRFRASFPFRWIGDVREAVPPEQVRGLTVRFTTEPDGTRVVEHQRRTSCDDVGDVPAHPTRAELTAALSAFLGQSEQRLTRDVRLPPKRGAAG